MGGEGRGRKGGERERERVGGGYVYLRANPSDTMILLQPFCLFSRQEERGGRLEGTGCKEQDHQGHG